MGSQEKAERHMERPLNHVRSALAWGGWPEGIGLNSPQRMSLRIPPDRLPCPRSFRMFSRHRSAQAEQLQWQTCLVLCSVVSFGCSLPELIPS